MCLSFLLLLFVTSALCQERSPRDTSQDALRVLISDGCVSEGQASDLTSGGKELSLSPGAPLVLTHQIRLVPPTPGSAPGSGPGSCGCDSLADLRERVERLEREVSTLRQKCEDPESAGCCSSRESKGSGCSVSPESPQCPNECSDQGRCEDGLCVCFPGFTGPDCGESQCPGNCNSRGRCVDGQCECDPGFSGADCSRSTCPDDCSSRGRCVDGRCVCDPGFEGDTCGDKTCPGNCNNRGRCVDGRCVCEEGFTGDDCSTKGCPGNCNNRGRCVKGKCVCRRGFSGADCGQCQDGLTGTNCDTVMSAVEELRTKDLTQSSVSVVWTQPPVQYESYLLTFTSQKDEAQVQAEVPGSQSSFSQIGLAPGQLYTVTVTGRTGERRGAQGSTTFTTLPAGPSDLRVVKTSTSSVVVQWEPSLSPVDRYRLSVSRGDGAGRGQELTFDPGTSSAHITGLEAGTRYDITLVAEKGRSQSEPISTQATPGSANVLVAALSAPPTSERNDDRARSPDKPNVTKVIRKIELRPGDDTGRLRAPESGSDSGSEGVPGIDLTSPKERTTCLNRVTETHGRPGPRDGGCRDGTAASATDLEVGSPDPLRKLLTDTFQHVNITAFDIRLFQSEPSNLDANAEIVAKRIMEGSKPKSARTSPHSNKPHITSLFFVQPQTTAASPTSTSLTPAPSASGDDSRTENANYRRTQPNRTIIRRINPNLWQFRNKTSKDGSGSLPSRKMNITLTLSDEGARNLDKDGVSEGEKRKEGRFPLNARLDGQDVPNSRPFQNNTHPNQRLFRRPYRIPQNKTETASTTDAPLRNVGNLNITWTRTGFNRSRPGFPRRPHSYLGPFQNRTRLIFRSPQRGPVRNPQNGPNSAIGERTDVGRGSNRQNGRSLGENRFEGDVTKASGSTDPPGNKETTDTGQPSASGVGETSLGKEDNKLNTQETETEPQEETTNGRLGKNVLEDKLRIDSDSGNLGEDNMSFESSRELTEAGRDVTEVRFGEEFKDGNPNLVASFQAMRTTEQIGEQDRTLREKDPKSDGKQGDSQDGNSGTVFRRPSRPGAHPAPTRRRIPLLRNMTRNGFRVNATLQRGLNVRRDERKSEGSLDEAERSSKPTEQDERETMSNGGGNELEIAEPASANRRTQPNPTITRRLRPNLWQFRNKTGLSAREGDGPLSLSSERNTSSYLSSRKEDNLEDNRVSDGETQSGGSDGSSGSRRLDEMFPETDYKVTVLGRGSGVLSQLHKLVISTGPEPPSDLVFSSVTEDSVTVSWTRPKSKISGFKVTYTHSEDAEPVSVSLDQGNSSVDLSRLTPGSVYEVSVLSVLGLDESDAISKTLHTLPDPPTDLRAVNVSDTGALLLWRPALAAVDHYTIVYGAGTGSEVRVTVSGNTAEKQLNDLEPSTTYSVTISSELDARKSREATTSFITTGSGEPGDLRATNVRPRSATLSWKPPARPVIGYRVTYWTEGQRKEVSVVSTTTQLNLTRLFPGSEYSVELRTEGGDQVLTTTFTTGSLQFPFPSDCSQEQLNGFTESGLVDIFPLGQQGAPLSVWCDMDTDGGGWTVFQRRKDGSVDFFKTWKEYVQGFGDPSGEFWLGLDALHTLTSRSRMTLRVDLSDGQDSAFAQYSTFEVAKRNYRLTVGGYSGTAGDSMAYHNNRIFSTKDRDPASFVTRCAMSYRGGWWYKNCHEANLNGLYGITSKHQGIIWMSWKGKEASIPFTEMKMRPTDFLPNKNNYRA